MKTAFEKVVNAIDRAISPEAISPESVPPHVAASRAILQICPLDVTKAELSALTKAHLDYQEGARIIQGHNYGTSKQRWIEYQAGLVATIQAGKGDAASGYSLEEFAAEEESLMNAGKAACRAASAAAIATAGKIAQRFAAIADRFAAEREAEEKASYRKFGLSYPGPSPLIRTLKEVGIWAKALVPTGVYTAGTGTAPSDMVPYIQL